MAYSTADARQEILDVIADAADHIGVALAALGAAYELVDEAAGDRLESTLFRPVQVAYGRARRAHEAFAARTGLSARSFAQPAPGHLDAHGQIDRAVTEARTADDLLAELQDSMLPVEVGDPELRAALADVREHLDAVGRNARSVTRVLGCTGVREFGVESGVRIGGSGKDAGEAGSSATCEPRTPPEAVRRPPVRRNLRMPH